MRIDSLKITNFKSFENKDLEFTGNFSLIIGDNGTGKTSILESLSIGLGGFIIGIDGIDTRNIYNDEIRVTNKIIGDATVNTSYHTPCEIECSGIVNEEKITWKRSLNKLKGRTTRTDAKKIIDVVEKMQQKINSDKSEEVILPILSYQGAGRLYSQKREKWVSVFKQKNLSRVVGYTDSLEVESNFKLFVDWLNRMTLIALQKQKTIGELQSVLQAISTFMQSLSKDKSEVSISYDLELGEVAVQLNGEQLPLRLLSSGYRSLIGMVADIAFRMSLLNPQLKDKASQLTPGVVLIDELDLHLHPEWQWNIVEDLKRTFPLVQFIATTHSPIIISSCKDGEIINIDNKETKNKKYYGWQVQDILNQVMESKNRTPEIQRDIERFEELFDEKMNGNSSGELELEKLENKLLEILPESDPATTLAKLSYIKKSVKKVEDNHEKG